MRPWSYCPPDSDCPECRLLRAIAWNRRARLQRRRDFVVGFMCLLGAVLLLALVEGFTTTVIR